MSGKLLLLLVTSLPVWGLSNAVTIQEKSGSTQSNRVLTTPRYFAQGEICQYPQPYVSGSAIANWQADVKTRWPADSNCSGGYVKIALVTAELTLGAGSNTVMEFRNSASSSSSGSGLTQSAMLAFSTGSGVGTWGAGWTATTGGVTITCRLGSAIPCGARDMIAAGFYKVLESGPLRTSVLVREGPDDVTPVTTRTTSVGWQCLTNCTAPYNTAAWANNAPTPYHSIRPSYVVTFYTSPAGGVSNNRVETDYLLDNGWLDRAQDQRFESIELDTGASENTPCYTAPAVFVLPFRARMFETCWQAAAPGAVNIDFNRAYVTYSKMTPAYGLNWVIGAAAIAAEVGPAGSGTTCGSGYSCSFGQSDEGATTNSTISPQMGWGQDFDHGGATGGGAPINGWAPRWTARYIVSGFNAALLPVILGNAKAYMHAPIFPLETSTTATFQTGGSTKAFGRVVSIDVRTDYNSWQGSGTSIADAPSSPAGASICGAGGPGCAGGYGGAQPCSAPTCMVTCATRSSAYLNFCSVYDGNNVVNQWGLDPAHSREMFFIPYLVTGKYVYLEGEQAMAAWVILAPGVGNNPPTGPWTRWGSNALFFDTGNLIRGTAEPMRLIGLAAAISSDGSTEQAYFTQKLNNNFAAQEGYYGVTNGQFAPSDPTCAKTTNAQPDIWHMVRCFYMGGQSNPVGLASAPHDLQASGSNFACGGCNMDLTNDGTAPWMEQYHTVFMGGLRDLGFRAAGVHTAAARHSMGMFGDSNYGLAFPGQAGVIEYAIPMMSGTAQSRTGYLQNWAAVKAAHIESGVLARALGSSDTMMWTPDWNDTGGVQISINMFDAANKDGSTYYKIDNEFVLIGQIVPSSTFITAVNTSLSQVTANMDPGYGAYGSGGTRGHGLTDGQITMVSIIPGYQGAIDNGMVGNPNCGRTAGGRTNSCRFYAHVVDAYTLQFYNDAAMTSLVTLTGGSSYIGVNNGKWTISRGMLGSTPAAHAEGATWTYWSIVTPGGRVAYPDSHAFFYTSALATAVDYDVTVVDSGTGNTITAQRAFDLANQVVWNQAMAGANLSTCANIMTCDEPRWGILPRPLIRNVRVNPGSTSATLYYSPPDGNPCRIGTSTTPFASSDDSGDIVDGSSALGRAYTVASLQPGTTYYYRISCGPAGGSARTFGTFSLSR